MTMKIGEVNYQNKYFFINIDILCLARNYFIEFEYEYKQ